MNAQLPTSNAQLPTNPIQQRINPNIKYDLEERLLEYAAQIIFLVEKLPNSRSGNHVAGHLLRCGTSPLPNHGEAQAAESAADFIHKMSICLKELRETRRWLRLAKRVWESTVPAEIDRCWRKRKNSLRFLLQAFAPQKKIKLNETTWQV